MEIILMKQKKITTAVKLLTIPAFAAMFALPAITASAAETNAVPGVDRSQYAMGDVLTDLEYVSDPEASEEAQSFVATDSIEELPAQVDLSQSKFFPAVGDQMQVGSCYAFSSTYYQFTYEANKLNNIETNADNAYSPAFVYNFRTSTRNTGGTCTDAYDFLKEHGSLRWAEMPYRSVNGNPNIDEDNYDYSLSTDTDAMIDALHTRVSSHGAVTIPGTGTPITGPNSASLNEVKQMLADGKVLSVRVDGFNWNYGYRKEIDPATGNAAYYHNADNETERVAYRGYRIRRYYDGGHAVTIVGYDDTVWYDFNGNGIQEEAETGAFKMANSWGTDYCNDGYVWVMYDALNRVSAVDGDWESGFSYTRIPVFDRDEDMSVNGQKNVNALYYMNVEKKDVYYVGQVDVTTDDALPLVARLGRTGASNSSRTVLSNTDDYDNELPFSGTLAFDYAALCDEIGDHLTGYEWFLRLTGDYSAASFRITDDLSNTIVDCGAVADNYASGSIALVDGDLNYDGQFTQADVDIYESGAQLSTLQQYLAKNIHSIPIPPTPGPVDSNLTATASVVASWEGGQVVSVTVKNNGTEPVCGWAFSVNSFEGEITDIWGADILSGNIVRGAAYTSEIPAGGEVVFGYVVSNPTTALPVFTEITNRTDVSENCTVVLNSSNNWGTGFIGIITITNDSDEAIYGWTLTIRADGFTIDNNGALAFVDNGDGTYTISSNGNNVEIAAHSSITIQFQGTPNGTPSISVVSLNAVDL